ncbi:MAG: orotidine-5'-phosphate decarboxylase [Planctomycetes bacterium]|nr:orotidine-5'-phosphate decarboxylase [Planctomycetota bacterium]
MPTSHCFDRLAELCQKSRSAICVGLDPHYEQLPPDPKGRGVLLHVRDFLFDVIGALEGVVPCLKPQIAFFEALGPDGYALYFEIVREAHRRGFFVIGDIKRADIGSTAAAYAKGHLGPDDGSAVDAVTLNPYLGVDGIEPFLKVGRAKGRGVFVLARTSNPSGKEIQDVGAAGPGVANSGGALYRRVGALLEQWGATNVGTSGYSDVGAVVGATHPDEGALLRRELPKTFFLVPGYGAQGGTAADVACCFDARGGGAVVNSSRGVLFAWKEQEKSGGAARFAELARAAAISASDAIRAAVAGR